MCQWKYFENRFISGEDMDSDKVGRFLRHSVVLLLKTVQAQVTLSYSCCICHYSETVRLGLRWPSNFLLEYSVICLTSTQVPSTRLRKKAMLSVWWQLNWRRKAATECDYTKYFAKTWTVATGKVGPFWDSIYCFAFVYCLIRAQAGTVGSP